MPLNKSFIFSIDIFLVSANLISSDYAEWVWLLNGFIKNDVSSVSSTKPLLSISISANKSIMSAFSNFKPILWNTLYNYA